MFKLNRRDFIIFMFVSVIGCAKKAPVPFAVKPDTPPKPVHCFDAVGHMPGTMPFVLGGTCCCTPTQVLMEQFHAEGKLLDMQVDDLILLYEKRGIKLQTRDHQNCNNLCEYGPHVVKGGKCMASPTPGTVNFEEVRYNMRYMPNPDFAL